VLHTSVEQGGTCIVMGWKGYSNAREGLFGSVIDQVVSRSSVPVLVCHPGEDDATKRVVVVVTGEDLAPGGEVGTGLAFEVGARMARQAEVELIIVSDVDAQLLRPALSGVRVRQDDVEVIVLNGVVGQLPTLLRAGDVVITGMPPSTSRLGKGARRLARAARGRTVIVAVPH
jgi:hypothetical protein